MKSQCYNTIQEMASTGHVIIVGADGAVFNEVILILILYWKHNIHFS